MQMIDVLKRLAELDAANPNRPEYKVDNGQNITTVISESADVAECGMMGGAAMGSMDRPNIPASINMTAATGEELGHLIKDIMSLAGLEKTKAEPLSTTPAIGLASRDGTDMKSMMDKLNDIETVETIDSMPNDPMPTEPFDAEQYAHHENPPGADRKGNANNPRAYDTNEDIANNLMAEYRKFISEDQDVEEGDSWRQFKSRELGHELAHERNNYAVTIDGRVWKVFADQRQAQNIARSLQNKGKNAEVSITGASPSEGAVEGVVEDNNDIDQMLANIEKEAYAQGLEGDDELEFLRVKILDLALDRVGRDKRKGYEPHAMNVMDYDDAKEFLTVAFRDAVEQGVAEGPRDEDEQEFIARQKRLAASDDKPKDPKRQAFLDKIPGYKDAMALAQKTTKDQGVAEAETMESILKLAGIKQ